MKLHIITTLGLALASGAVLAQTGALPSTPSTDPQQEENGTPKGPIDVQPNDDGTLGGTINGGVEGATGAVSGTADPQGQSGKTGGKASLSNAEFGKLDMNHNGSLTRDEVRADAKVLSQFNKMDSNGDGKVDEKEYSVSLRARTGGDLPADKNDSKSNDKSSKDESKTNDKRSKDQAKDILPGG